MGNKKLTPLQIVRKNFENKKKLVDTILSLMTNKEEKTRAKLQSSSNKKLLRLFKRLSSSEK